MTTIFVYDNGTGRKSFPVEAEIFGALAVHRSIDDIRKDWKVTHIKTGAAIAAAKTQDLAIKIAKELALLDWSGVKTQKSRQAIKAIAPYRAAILEKHGVKP